MAKFVPLDAAFTGGSPKLVPAKRTKRERVTIEPGDFTPPTSDKAGTLPKDSNLRKIITDAASEFGVPAQFALALAQQESGYNPKAINAETQATGLMQYIPDTAARLNLDPRDPAASARAAMRQFAEQAEKGGVEWAIKHHFAGPNTAGHGPKTRQYLADVMKRAQDIEGLLAGESESVDAGGVGGSSDEKPAGRFIPLDQAFTTSRPRPAEAPKQEDGFLSRSAGYAIEASEKVWDHISKRFKTDMGLIAADSPDYTPAKGAADPFQEVRDTRGRIERRQRGETITADQAEIPKGFFANLENPVKLFTQDSLPANFVEWLANAGELNRNKFLEARKVAMQEDIVANPHKYPRVSVDAARQAIEARKKKQDPTIGSMWRDLKQAAKEDPGRFGAQLVNAMMADPEMIAAPIGMGIKVTSATNRAAKIGNAIVDAGSTSAALNLAIEGAAAASEGRTMTGSEVGMAAGTGFVVGGALGPIFMRGAKAREQLKAGTLAQDEYANILKDVAKEELAVEDIISSKNPVDASVRHQIEQTTGIKFESDADLKTYLDTTRKEWKQLFADRDLNGQYQKALAEERISRRQQIAEESEGRAASQQRQREIEAAYTQRNADRTAQYLDEYERALAAREEAATADAHTQALAEEELRVATAKADEQEIFEAALDKDVPAIRNAILKAEQRDAKLRMPKWQRGEVDPRILRGVAVGAGFGTAAMFAVPEEDKDKRVATGLAAGLAGFLLPKGGTVLRRMKQSGAIASNGDIVGLGADALRLVKEGKLKLSRAADDAAKYDLELVNRAKGGDEAAFQELFKSYYPRIVRVARNYLGGAGQRIGIEAEDIAQEVFVAAYQALDKFEGRAKVSTWLHGITENKSIDAVRKANANIRGKDYYFESENGVRNLEDDGEAYNVFDEGAGADVADTPEAQVARQDSEQILLNAIDRLPESQKQIFLMRNVEQMEFQEIADTLGMNFEAVRKAEQRASEFVTASVAKGFNASKVPKATGVVGAAAEEVVKRGRGRPPGSKNRPKDQAGFVDPKILRTAAILALGTTAGAAYINSFNVDKDGERLRPGDKGYRNPLITAATIVGTGALLFGAKGAGLKNLGRHADDLLGASSTRILNKSKSIHRRILGTERTILSETHRNLTAVDPFLHRLHRMPKEGRDIITRALMTGKGAVIDRVLKAVNDPELISGYKAVRQVLDSLGDKLVDLKRFSKGNIEYFPRVVKDKEGLFEAIGKTEASTIKQALQDANVESMRKHGRPLSELEESAIINQMLFIEKRSIQPGFTKNRGIEEITPELQKFYASAEESLHSYIRDAVQDIEAAKFFGGSARNMKRGNFEYLDVDRSVKNLLADDVKSGKLSDDDAKEIADILRARFKEGLRGEAELIRTLKNFGNMGLLGNFWSALTQMADVGVQVYTQGLMPTIESVVRQMTGKKFVDVKDFGLVDHISEEFAGQLKSSRALHKIFKYTLFAGADQFGKNTALNAAIIRAKGLAQTDAGVLKLASKYEEAFGPDFNRLVSDLKSGKITDLTRDYAFMELSRTQPVSRIEMPLAYLKHPNARSYLWLKSFTMKQLDLVRRDALNEMKNGNYAKGVKNLIAIGATLGISGATTDMVKDWLLGRDAKLLASDIPVNMFKTFGMSEYVRDQALGVSPAEAARRREAGEAGVRSQKPEPLQAVMGVFAPPAEMYDKMISGDPKAIRYLVPGVGPYLAEHVAKVQEMEREVADE